MRIETQGWFTEIHGVSGFESPVRSPGVWQTALDQHQSTASATRMLPSGRHGSLTGAVLPSRLVTILV